MKIKNHTIGDHEVEIIEQDNGKCHVKIDGIYLKSRCGFPDAQEAYDSAKYAIALKASRPNLID